MQPLPTRFAHTAFASVFIVPLILAACSGRGDVDLSKATPLTAEPVASGPAAGQDPNPGTPHNLFGLSPGKWVSFKAVSGAIDPVGTTLSQDFDGDGIENAKETSTNIWVADYPMVEAQIATPVTMKIQILKNSQQESDEISSDITSDDVESRKNQGSEKFHQNELNEKTVQYEREVKSNSSSGSSSSSTTSSSASTGSGTASASGAGIFSGKVELKLNLTSTSNSTRDNTYSFNNSESSRGQVFEDRPFKNNLDRTSGSVKADSAAKKARTYRKEKRNKGGDSMLVNSNAGVVRAALYIKNNSVNMPVKLSNILASLVFETGQGALIPIQSFRLRNDDFSLFEVEVYGNSEFGPYVVDLPGLNTVEVENAITAGYTPKIYIVDYTMTHVQDSNYRTALSSKFTGNNLKIIEENAKGRTALLKLTAPNYRQLIRVVAFDAQLLAGETDICDFRKINTTDQGLVKPGISMKRALERLKCSGINIEFEHFILDFTDTPLPPKIPKIYVHGIKSMNGLATKARCTSTLQGIGVDPGSPTGYGPVNACVIKVSALTQDELFNLSLWTVFDNGKYYNQAEFVKNSSNQILSFNGGSVEACNPYETSSSASSSSSSTSTSSSGGAASGCAAIPVLKGVESTVWAGDNYDITYLTIADMLGILRSFGTNPLETGEALPMNTKWTHQELGANPYDPEVRSKYLGKAGLGDQVKITFDLKDTTFLNPNFGEPKQGFSSVTFDEFTYNRQKANKKFNVEEAVDFEISLGLGGQQTDWQNIMRPVVSGGSENENITKVSATIDYLAQQFAVTIKIPDFHHLVGSDGLVNLYVRPALSNAYRDTVWPEDHRVVKKFDSRLIADAAAGTNTISITYGTGMDGISAGEQITVQSGSSTYTYTVQTVGYTGGGYLLTLTSNIGAGITHKTGDRAYVPGNLSSPHVFLTMDNAESLGKDFLTAWNQENPGRKLLTPSDTSVNCTLTMAPTRCYGYTSANPYDYFVNNWLGNASLGNSWSSGDYVSFPYKNLEAFAAAAVSEQTGVWSLGYSRSPIIDETLSNGPINLATLGSQQNPRIAVLGEKALVFYNSNATGLSAVQSRLVNLNNDGTPYGSEVTVNKASSSTAGQYWTASTGGKAVAVWSATPMDGGPTHVFSRVMNVATNTTSSVADIQISQTSPGTNIEPRIAIWGNRGLVTWRNFYSSGSGIQNTYFARFINASTGQPLGQEFLLTASYVHVNSLILEASNDRAIVIWHSNEAGFACRPKIRVFSLSQMSTLVNEIPFGGNTSVTACNLPEIAVFDNRALIVWEEYDGQSVVRGRFIDLVSGNPVGSGPFLVQAASSGPSVSMDGDKALIMWTKNHQKCGQVYSSAGETPLGSIFCFGSGYDGAPVRQVMRGNYVFTAWEFFNGSGEDIVSIFLDLSKSDPTGGMQPVNFTNSPTEWDYQPVVAISGNRAELLFTTIRSNGSDIYSFTQTILPKFGANNFFQAPFIERNFEATARIVK